jgi:hypothetical protein
MAQITINVPDAQLSRVLDAFAAVYGWTAASGLTKAQLAKEQLKKYMLDTVRQYEAQAAYQQAADAVGSQIVLT